MIVYIWIFFLTWSFRFDCTQIQKVFFSRIFVYDRLDLANDHLDLTHDRLNLDSQISTVFFFGTQSFRFDTRSLRFGYPNLNDQISTILFKIFSFKFVTQVKSQWFFFNFFWYTIVYIWQFNIPTIFFTVFYIWQTILNNYIIYLGNNRLHFAI